MSLHAIQLTNDIQSVIDTSVGVTVLMVATFAFVVGVSAIGKGRSVAVLATWYVAVLTLVAFRSSAPYRDWHPPALFEALCFGAFFVCSYAALRRVIHGAFSKNRGRRWLQVCGLALLLVGTICSSIGWLWGDVGGGLLRNAVFVTLFGTNTAFFIWMVTAPVVLCSIGKR